MIHKKYIFFIFAFLLLISTSLQAARINGRVTDKAGTPLPFATVVVQGTTKGTSTNLDGYYALELPQGTYNLVFQYVGYQAQTRPVVLSGDEQTLNIQLEESLLELTAITVKPNGEDPAYDLIREAQAKRKYHLEEYINTYKCNIYTKIFKRSTRDGGRINVFGAASTVRKGVFYLSETLSELNFKQKSKYYERVLASKVSGDSTGYSYNRANWLNLYRNQTLSMNDYDIISPIAEQAMQYYEYKLENIEVENNHKIYKIRLLPKYKGAPVFTGHLYLLDNTWNIHSLDAQVAADVVSNFDSTTIRQVYVPIEGKSVWVPFSLTTYFQLFGGAVEAYYHAIATDYEVNLDLPDALFEREVLGYADDATLRTDDYWQKLRPIPLIQEEIEDYQKYQQIALTNKEENKEEDFSVEDDLDTLANQNQQKRSRFNILRQLFSPQTIQMGKRSSLGFEPLLNMIDYNTVEGWRLEYGFRFNHQINPSSLLRIAPFFRYGFSNEAFQSKIQLEYQWNKSPGGIRLEGGRYVSQLSNNELIPENLNSIYTLMRGFNYLKLYQKNFLNLQFRQEWVNGISTTIGVEWAERSPMQNNSNQSWNNRSEIIYTPNAPLNVELEDTNFEQHNALILQAGLDFRFGQEYIIRPTGKVVERVRGPQISLTYRKGMMDLDYDWLRVGLRDVGRLGTLGRFQLKAEAGKFVNNERLFFLDFHHFAGNRTLMFQNVNANNFQLLDYYTYSTRDEYVQGHFSHHFEGLLMSLIPGVRSLKWALVAEVNYLYTTALPNYTEIGLGIDKIFNLLRVDCYHSLNRAENVAWGVRLRVGRNEW